MSCSNCSAELADGAVFCSSCGAPQVNDPGAATITFKVPEDPILASLKKELSGDYEVEKELGRGGMAVVYKAVEVALNRTVALKVVPPETATGNTAERFKREARMAASLDHQNIIPVYRVAQAGNLLYMSMKFVEGKAVDTMIEQQGPLPVPIVLEVLRASAHALAYAHDHGIVHRDIKGANILIDKDGRVLVSDFGIARAVEEKSMTASGMIIGTPYFMSPEQCGGLKVGPQSDQYSLGIMAFQMLTGEVPFDADSVMGIIQHHYMTPVPDIGAVRDDVPEELLQVIYRALNKDVDDRYASTQLFADAFDAVPDPPGTTKRDGQNMLKAIATGTGDSIPKIRTASLPPLAPTGVMPKAASMPNLAPVRTRGVTGSTKAVEAPKSNTGMIVGGVALVGAAAGAYFMFGNKPKTEAGTVTGGAAPVPVAAESGYVKFAKLPPGATITIDDKPFEGDSGYFPRGDVIYKVKAPGYKTVSEAVRVPAGKTFTVELAMDKEAVAAPPPKTPPPTTTRVASAPEPAAPVGEGTLTVAADPVFANISLDGAAIGSGRVIGAKVRAGNHTVRVSADGYDTKSISITVQANTPVSLGKVTLTKTGGP